MTENESLKTAEICFQAVLEEYRNYSERIEKLNIRIQIAFAACAFLFAVMIDTMKNINFYSEVLVIGNSIYLSLFFLFHAIVIGIFIYVFFKLLSILRGSNIQRLDSKMIIDKELINNELKKVVDGLIKNYDSFLTVNDNILNEKYKQFHHCLFWIGVYALLLLIMFFINSIV